MKKAIFMIAFMLIAALSKADDTATLQASVKAGNYTATSGHVYNITTDTLYNNLNLNGAKINCTGGTGVACLIFPTAKKKVSNGEIYGQSDLTNTTTFGTGTHGIKVLADSDTIANMRIHKFSAYGIIANNVNNTVVLNSNIYDTGYIGMFFHATSFAVEGPKCISDTFNRSMISATLPTSSSQAALQIKGSTGDTVYNALIYNCVLQGPYKPVDWTAECTEDNVCVGLVVAKSKFYSSSIGVSLANSSRCTVNGNSFINCQLEAIEFANAQSSIAENNSISNQVAIGILFDTNSQNNILINNNIRGCPGNSIQFSTGSNNNTLIGNTITAPNFAVFMASCYGINFYSNYFIGAGGADAIQIANSRGLVRIIGGTISGFTNKAVYVFNNGSVSTDKVADKIYMAGVSMIGMTSGLRTVLSGGASVGTHVMVN